jgi:hypothetical protein
MRLVDDDEVVAVNRDLAAIATITEDSPHHALDGGHMDLGGGVGRDVAKFLDVVDLGEHLVLLQAHVLEGVLCLFAERGAVDEEKDAVEAFGLQQPVDQPDDRPCLAGSRGHGDQAFTLAIGDARFDGPHGAHLVVAQRQVRERFRLKFLFRSSGIGFKQLYQRVGGMPAEQRPGMMACLPNIAEPDAALGLELLKERAAVRRINEGNPVVVLRAVLVLAVEPAGKGCATPGGCGRSRRPGSGSARCSAPPG